MASGKAVVKKKMKKAPKFGKGAKNGAGKKAKGEK